MFGQCPFVLQFQHTAARRRLDQMGQAFSAMLSSFNTQPPEGGWSSLETMLCQLFGFNTQPPEGGWRITLFNITDLHSFNTQPPEGGWPSVL